jgi:hypothetical protein
MRHGLMAGALMISHYVRSLLPYRQAHEEGMGIAQVSANGSAQPSPAREGASPEEIEERMLREELRALQRQRTSDATAAAASAQGAGRDQSLVPPPVVAPANSAARVGAVEELSIDDLIEEERTEVPEPAAQDRLGLDQFDQDEEIKPVVLLSPKRKSTEKSPAEGGFMNDLERRLREEAES